MIYFNRKGLLYSFIQKETRVMNLALFMLTFMLSGLYATESYSQTVRISLNMKNSTVKEVLKKIENCSEFTFFYNDEIIDVDKRVTLNAEDLSISDILTTILPNCSYTISNKNIIITVKEAGVHQQGKIVTGVVRDVNGEPVVGANVSVKGTTNGTITDMAFLPILNFRYPISVTWPKRL